MSQPYASFYGGGQIMTFMEVYSLCVHSYSDLRAGQELTGTGTTWTVEQVIENHGFMAYKIRKHGGWYAIVFRGTNFEDAGGDWLRNNIANALGHTRPPQYVSGEDLVSKHGAGKILVGHSLGGGIAMFASAFHGLPAATIFPAPVIPDSLPNGGANANVVNYVCHGEVLTELTAAGRSGSFLRDAATDYLDRQLTRGLVHRRLGDDYWVRSNGGNPIERHMLNNIVLS